MGLLRSWHPELNVAMTKNAKPARISRTGLARHALLALLGRPVLHVATFLIGAHECTACSTTAPHARTQFDSPAARVLPRTRLGLRHDLVLQLLPCRMDHGQPMHSEQRTGDFLSVFNEIQIGETASTSTLQVTSAVRRQQV
jgi:hypothetical protein